MKEMAHSDLFSVPLFFLIFIYLFGCAGSYLQQVGSLVVACELLVAACMWDLVPRPGEPVRPGLEPGTPALGVQSPIHCATREGPSVTL